MNIDFDKMDLSVIPNFKGGEKELHARMFFDGSNRIMKARLIPGASIGMHTHEGTSEVIFSAEQGTVVTVIQTGDSGVTATEITPPSTGFSRL